MEHDTIFRKLENILQFSWMTIRHTLNDPDAKPLTYSPATPKNSTMSRPHNESSKSPRQYRIGTLVSYHPPGYPPALSDEAG